jgi:chromosome segregation ATPase
VSALFIFVLTGTIGVSAETETNKTQKNDEQRSEVTSNKKVETLDNATSSDENDVEESDNATSSEEDEVELIESGDGNNDNIGEQHKNDVEKVASKLEKIANKNKDNDEMENEVKNIIKEEKDVSEKVKEKMDTVNQRGGFKIFFIGADYKNLGELRSDLQTTENHIDRLNKVLEKTTSTTTKAELQTQIQNLSTIQKNAENFISSEEGKFSLFGWLVKMFQ